LEGSNYFVKGYWNRGKKFGKGDKSLSPSGKGDPLWGVRYGGRTLGAVA